MELPISIFVLLFILVIILIFLHKSNKKYADKISILEQTLNMKVDAVTSLKSTYAEAKQAIEKHASQESEILLKIQTINHLENNIQTLKENIESQKKDLQKKFEKVETMRYKLRKKEKENEDIKSRYEKEIISIKNNMHELEYCLSRKEDKIIEINKEMQKEALHAHELKEQMQISIEGYIENIISLKEQYQIVQKDSYKNDTIFKQKLEEKDNNVKKLQTKYLSEIGILNEKIQTLNKTRQQEKDFISKLNYDYEELELSYTNEKELYSQNMIKKDNIIKNLEDSYEKKLNNSKNILNDKVVFIQEQKKHISTIETLYSTSKNKIESLEEIIQNKSDECQMLIENTSRQKKEFMDIQEERNSLQKNLAYIQGLYGIEKEKVNRVTLEMKILCKEYKTKEEYLINNYLLKQKEIEKIQTESEVLKLEIKTFKESKYKWDKEQKKQENTITILNTRNEKISSQYKQLKAKYDKECNNKNTIVLKNIEMENVLLEKIEEMKLKDKRYLLQEQEIDRVRGSLKKQKNEMKKCKVLFDELDNRLINKENIMSHDSEEIYGLHQQLNSLKEMRTTAEGNTKKEYYEILRQIRRGDDISSVAKAFGTVINSVSTPLCL